MNIIVKEKDDSISWEEVTEVLHSAHQSTKAQGMNFKAGKQSAMETKKRVADGKVIIALLEPEKKVVGTCAVTTYTECEKWYWKKAFVKFEMICVAEKYKGFGISKKILNEAERKAFCNFDLIELDTAENNRFAINMYKRRGFVLVDYVSWVGTNYYSVVMAKWKWGCPYSKIKCKLRFFYRKMRCKLLKDCYGRLRIKKFING